MCVLRYAYTALQFLQEMPYSGRGMLMHCACVRGIASETTPSHECRSAVWQMDLRSDTTTIIQSQHYVYNFEGS